MRKKKNYSLYVILIILSILVLGMGILIIFNSFSFYVEKNKDNIEIIKNLSYKVKIKEDSKYYEKDTIEEQNDFVASAISKIISEFSVNLKTKKEEDLKYEYRIDGELTTSSSGEVVKRKDYELVALKKVKLELVKNTKIKEEVEIDYKRFLDDVEEIKKDTGKVLNSNLTVEMNLSGKSKNYQITESMKLEIPITNQNKKIKIRKIISKQRESLVPKVVFKISNYNYLVGGTIIVFGSIVLFITGIISIQRIKKIKQIRKRITNLKRRSEGQWKF